MPFFEDPPTEIGCPIPAHTPHAVSVTLPTWSANVGYEEGAPWVISKMASGYPRFYIHEAVRTLGNYVTEHYGREGEHVMLFPSFNAAKRCREFLEQGSETKSSHRILRISVTDGHQLSALFYGLNDGQLAKSYWQHTGEGISSRFAEFAFNVLSGTLKGDDLPRFIEERFGRNLDTSYASSAKAAIKCRIADHSTHPLNTEDVYLYPTGMTAIFNAHRALLDSRGEDLKSVVFGFPYVDSLHIHKKFGAGTYFYGNGSPNDLIELESLLAKGEPILSFFCEFPSNPLLKSPDLEAISKLADKYNFPIVIDDTIGNFANVNVLQFADVVVSSLTKVFSGDSNVMGGSLILNSSGKFYGKLKETLNSQYEDTMWDEDSIFLERNSRDFKDRSTRMNANAEAIASLFVGHPSVHRVYYPKFNDSKSNYDRCKTQTGGYGSLLSVVFKNGQDAITFFDRVATAKGPSLGTNFTLTSPYTILAHYNELDFVEQFGVDRYLIRISVGLEDEEDLKKRYREALQAITRD